MFRRIHEALAGLWHKNVPVPNDRDRDTVSEARTPDPCVWRLPDPCEARWRGWARRNRAAGHCLPFPQEEACWQCPARPRNPLWEAADDVVRLYVTEGATPHRGGPTVPQPPARLREGQVGRASRGRWRSGACGEDTPGQQADPRLASVHGSR